MSEFNYEKEKENKIVYLSSLSLNTLELLPLFGGLSQVHLAQRHLYFTDLVMLGESIKVKYSKHQCFVHSVGIWHILKTLNGFSQSRIEIINKKYVTRI